MPAEGLEPPTNGLQNERPTLLRSAPLSGCHPNPLIPSGARNAGPVKKRAGESRGVSHCTEFALSDQWISTIPRISSSTLSAIP
jgi:hypothetical protein